MWPFLDCEADGVRGAGKSSVPVCCRILRLPTTNTPPHSQSGSSASTRSLIKKRETMDPDRCVGGRGAGQKGRKVAGSPARRVKIRADTEGESV
jgi:hypothetical protein